MTVAVVAACDALIPALDMRKHRNAKLLGEAKVGVHRVDTCVILVKTTERVVLLRFPCDGSVRGRVSGRDLRQHSIRVCQLSTVSSDDIRDSVGSPADTGRLASKLGSQTSFLFC